MIGLRTRHPERKDRGLDCAVWEFTLRCNLRCSHCGSSAGAARAKELDTKECFRVVEQLAEIGCRDVALMGGEPLMRDDLYEVGQAVKQLGMNLNMVSNGTLMKDRIDQVRRLEPKVVGISLDGMKEAHESIRGAGTYGPTLTAVDLLRDAGIQTTVITTVSKVNFKDLPGMRKMLLGKGVNWQIQTAMPFGNFRRDLMLSREEFYATGLFIAKERLRTRYEDMPVTGAHCCGYYSKLIPGTRFKGCTAGISTVGITSDGGIVGCLSMGNDRFIEGNVRERSLVDIWRDPKGFKYTRGFAETDLGDNCAKCRHRMKCKGGCSSVSYALTGRFHNNPYCFHAIEKATAMR
jgi:radical SAM protein with 4Fe4S-binding SPASM domain